MSSTSSPDKTHAADQAGGDEVVFSSDGLTALPTVQPPSSIASTSKTDEVLEDLPTETADAFAAFGVKRTEETVTEKLARIQRELNDLQKAQDNSNSSIQNERNVVSEVQALQMQLTAVTMFQPGVSSKTTEEKAQASDTKLSNAASSSNHLLENRVWRLEQALGASNTSSTTGTSTTTSTTTNTSTTTKSLTQRLAALETLHSQLDSSSSSLDLWQRKAKTIRQDLEAAAKARHKLTSSSSSKDQSNKTLTELYNAWQDVQGLPLASLTQRLQALAHLHTHTATFAARLTETERAAQQLVSQLTTVEQATQQLQQSMEKNVEQMQENMKVLTDQLEKKE